jgi:hypothetical protein
VRQIGNNLLYSIKNRSKKSPISIAALDQFSFSKNGKAGTFNTCFKKNAFFYKPSSKNLKKQNME